MQDDIYIDVIESDETLWNSIPESQKVKFRTLPKEKCIFQIPISSFPFQPWSRHSTPSAWFNYDLNAQSWSL